MSIAQDYAIAFETGYKSVVRTADNIRKWQDKNEAENLGAELQTQLMELDKTPEAQNLHKQMRALNDPNLSSQVPIEDRIGILNANTAYLQRRAQLAQEILGRAPDNEHVQNLAANFINAETPLIQSNSNMAEGLRQLFVLQQKQEEQANKDAYDYVDHMGKHYAGSAGVDERGVPQPVQLDTKQRLTVTLGSPQLRNALRRENDDLTPAEAARLQDAYLTNDPTQIDQALTEVFGGSPTRIQAFRYAFDNVPTLIETRANQARAQEEMEAGGESRRAELNKQTQLAVEGVRQAGADRRAAAAAQARGGTAKARYDALSTSLAKDTARYRAELGKAPDERDQEFIDDFRARREEHRSLRRSLAPVSEQEAMGYSAEEEEEAQGPVFTEVPIPDAVKKEVEALGGKNPRVAEDGSVWAEDEEGNVRKTTSVVSTPGKEEGEGEGSATEEPAPKESREAELMRAIHDPLIDSALRKRLQEELDEEYKKQREENRKARAERGRLRREQETAAQQEARARAEALLSRE